MDLTPKFTKGRRYGAGMRTNLLKRNEQIYKTESDVGTSKTPERTRSPVRLEIRIASHYQLGLLGD